jgi:hypothetical protein
MTISVKKKIKKSDEIYSPGYGKFEKNSQLMGQAGEMEVADVYVNPNGKVTSFNAEGTASMDCSGYVIDENLMNSLKSNCSKNTNFHFTMSGNYAMQIPLALLAVELKKDKIDQKNGKDEFIDIIIKAIKNPKKNPLAAKQL